MQGKDVSRAMAGLEIEAMFSEKQIGHAIDGIKKGTSPGEDGLTTRFYAVPQVRERMVPHLRRLFMAAATENAMPALQAVLGSTQVANMTDGRGCVDTTLLLVEAARSMEESGAGGVVPSPA